MAGRKVCIQCNVGGHTYASFKAHLSKAGQTQWSHQCKICKSSCDHSYRAILSHIRSVHGHQLTMEAYASQMLSSQMPSCGGRA